MHWDARTVTETKITKLPHPTYYGHIEDGPRKPALPNASRGQWWGASYQQPHCRTTCDAGRAPPLGTWLHSIQPRHGGGGDNTNLREGGMTINQRWAILLRKYRQSFLLLKSWPRNKPPLPPQEVGRWLCSALQARL